MAIVKLFLILVLITSLNSATSKRVSELKVGTVEQHFDEEVVWLMGRLGTKVIRTDLWISDYRFYGRSEIEKLRKWIDIGKENGIEILFQVHDSEFSHLEPGWFQESLDPEYYEEMLRAYVWTFPDVTLWQLPSEQNLKWSQWHKSQGGGVTHGDWSKSISNYVELAKRAYDVVRHANRHDLRRRHSQAKLFFGGLSGYPGAANSSIGLHADQWLDMFLELYYQKYSGHPPFDLLALHPYNQGVHPGEYLKDSIESLERVLYEHYRPYRRVPSPVRARTHVKRGTRIPIAITEYGHFTLPAAGGMDHLTRGEHYKAFLEITNSMPRVEYAFMYEISDAYCWSEKAIANVPCYADNPEPVPHPEHHFGLFTNRIMTNAAFKVRDFILSQQDP